MRDLDFMMSSIFKLILLNYYSILLFKSILIKGAKNSKYNFLAFLTPQMIKTHFHQTF